MRVLHIVNGEHISGPERVVDNLVAHAQTVDPRVIALLYGEYVRERRGEVRVLASRGRGDVSVVPRLARLLRRERIDIVHTHTLRANLVGRMAGLLAGRPVIDHVHSPSWLETTNPRVNWIRTAVDENLRVMSTMHIAVSEWLGVQLEARGYGRERIAVCPNGIDVDRIENELDDSTPEKLRANLGLPAGVPVIGMFAMFRPRKGAEVLLDAFARSRARDNKAILALVGDAYRDGDSDYIQTLRTQADALGILAQVQFAGFQHHVQSWMAAATIGVVPSLFGEGIPIALLEQLAVGLPTIASRAPGIEEVAARAGGAVLTTPGDPIELANAIDRLVEDHDARATFAARGRATAREYAISKTVACVERAYRKVAQRRDRL